MSMKRPSIKQLEYFLTVARASSFRGAAEQLGLSQPALTVQIAALEAVLGMQLFDRSRAGTLLSPAGRELLPLAREILDQFQQLVDFSEQAQHEMAGTIRLGVSPTIGPYLLPRVLPVLHFDGTPITARFIAKAIGDHLDALKVTPMKVKS
jgi:LysR family hydrogen peroxide-inducible transcriptional activator